MSHYEKRKESAAEQLLSTNQPLIRIKDLLMSTNSVDTNKNKYFERGQFLKVLETETTGTCESY